MLTEITLAAERARACWYLLLAVDASRPTAAKEGVLRTVMMAASYPLTGLELRREIDFLAKSGLITIVKTNDATDEWLVELTAAGIQFVRYSSPDVPGIDRPPRRS